MNTIDAIVLVAAIAAAWMMTGLIWVVQLVHYPIFDRIDRGSGDAAWREFADFHRRSISFVVGLPMAVEGITGFWLVIDPPGSSTRLLPLLAFAAMVVAYGVTALVSVPLHGQLAERFDPRAHRRLVATNWWRTVAWSTRAVLLAALAIIAFTS